MARVKLFSDSTCDLTPELVQQYGIGIVPLYVHFGEEAYKDGVEMTTPLLYKKVEETGILPTTAAPSPGDIMQAFRPHVDAGEDIIFIGISTGMSATVNNARLAAAEFPSGKIAVVDSRNVSTGIALLLLKAADFAAQGMGIHDIAAKVSALTSKVQTEFIIDTLDYLHKGGRCSGLAKIMGSMLNIRPSITVIDGKMVPAQKFRGSRQKALNGLLQNALANKENISPERIFITHSVSEDGPWLKEQLEKHTDAKEVIITQTGCVVSSHCGPNTISILYLEK